MTKGFESGSLTFAGAVAMGTGVMIGAGIFALTGQVAELAGPWFPLAFLLAALVSGFSAYSYIKMAHAYPSAGGIAMFLNEAYGRGVMTGGNTLLMVFSMIVNESLVARTFGSYFVQLFGAPDDSLWVPALGVGLIGVAFLVNIATNELIGRISIIAAVLKVGGILIFALTTLWVAGFSFQPIDDMREPLDAGSLGGFTAAVALAVLAYKGFTTLTTHGDELENPKRNVGLAIVISLSICVVVYLLVAWAVGSTLDIDQIVEAKDYSLARASRPALGGYGLWFTVAVAIIATASGLFASIFAVSRMLTMVTKMELIPHRHFGMGGRIHTHVLVYTCVIASLLTIFFDLSRIASLGAIFYLVMDFAIHYGVFRHLRHDIDARGWVLGMAMALDLAVLAAFVWVKAHQDWVVLTWAIGGVLAIFLLEWAFLKVHAQSDGDDENYVDPL